MKSIINASPTSDEVKIDIESNEISPISEEKRSTTVDPEFHQLVRATSALYYMLQNPEPHNYNNLRISERRTASLFCLVLIAGLALTLWRTSVEDDPTVKPFFEVMAILMALLFLLNVREGYKAHKKIIDFTILKNRLSIELFEDVIKSSTILGFTFTPESKIAKVTEIFHPLMPIYRSIDPIHQLDVEQKIAIKVEERLNLLKLSKRKLFIMGLEHSEGPIKQAFTNNKLYDTHLTEEIFEFAGLRP